MDIETIAAKLTSGKARKSFGPSATHQQALQFGCRKSGFHVGVRYRDDKVRKVAGQLVKLGLFSFTRHNRYGDGMTYWTTAKGRDVMAQLNLKGVNDGIRT